jgi:hypothetical protein
VIVTEVNREGPCTTRYGHFLEGIQFVMNGFESVYFTHVTREANNVAHWLAKLATTHAIDSTWLENARLEICCIIRREIPIPSL